MKLQHFRYPIALLAGSIAGWLIPLPTPSPMIESGPSPSIAAADKILPTTSEPSSPSIWLPAATLPRAVEGCEDTSKAAEEDLTRRGWRPVLWPEARDPETEAGLLKILIKTHVDRFPGQLETHSIDCSEPPCIGIVKIRREGLLVNGEVLRMLDQQFGPDTPQLAKFDDEWMVMFLTERRDRNDDTTLQSRATRRIDDWKVEFAQ